MRVYVPADWLVGQREGKSNIAGRIDPRRFFRGAESIVSPSVEHTVVSVVGQRPHDVNFVAALLTELGVDMGANSQKKKPQNLHRLSHEAPGLHHLCSRLVLEPEFILQQSFAERVSHLKGWAWKRGHETSSKDTLIGGMNRNLCFLWDEMEAAWSGHLCIVALRPVSHDQTTDPRRISAIEDIKSYTSDRKLHLDLSQLEQNSKRHIQQLSSFLGLTLTKPQFDKAVALSVSGAS